MIEPAARSAVLLQSCEDVAARCEDVVACCLLGSLERDVLLDSACGCNTTESNVSGETLPCLPETLPCLPETVDEALDELLVPRGRFDCSSSSKTKNLSKVATKLQK